MLTAGAFALATLMQGGYALADHDPFGGAPQTSVTICHSGNGKNYNSISPNISATGGNVNLAGHAGHSFDIIPPFHFDDNGTILSYPGSSNWNAANEDRWNNGLCNGDGIVGPTTGTLVINKVVVNDDGGTATADDFTFKVNGGATTAFEADGSNSLTLAAGTYAVVETAAAGYTASYSNCTGVTLAAGGTATCTVTNNDDAPAPAATSTLVVQKVVVNDDGGTATADDFSFQLDGGAAVAFEADGSNSHTVTQGTHTVTEVAPSGYTVSYQGCDSFNVTSVTATCTITNNDNEPQGSATGTLTVSKVVSNNKGGPAQSSDFTLLVVDSNGATTTVTNNQPVEFAPGTYTVTETGGPGGYTATFGEGPDDDCDANGVVTITTGGFFDCRITNTDVGGTLLVRKVIVGDGTPDQFSFTLNGGAATPFEADGENMIETGAGITFTVAEVPAAGYTTVLDNCSGTIDNGETEICTITNTEEGGGGGPQTGTIFVQKVVINDNGGTATSSDFSFLVDGAATTSFEADGINELTLAFGVHSVSEVAAAGYTTSYVGCGEVTVGAQPVTCVITNDDNEPGASRFTLTVTTSGDGDGVVTGDGINCDSENPESDCTEVYDEGTEVTLTETPKEGSTFEDSWSGACSGNSPTCTVTMTGNTAVNANFSVASTGGGGGGGSTSRGRSNDGDDDGDGQVLGASTGPGDVLGAQVAVVPEGAPNAGAGSATAGAAYGLLIALAGGIGFSRTRKQQA